MKRDIPEHRHLSALVAMHVAGLVEVKAGCMSYWFNDCQCGHRATPRADEWDKKHDSYADWVHRAREEYNGGLLRHDYGLEAVPNYATSMDAALEALFRIELGYMPSVIRHRLPIGWQASVGDPDKPHNAGFGIGDNPATALCHAMLGYKGIHAQIELEKLCREYAVQPEGDEA